jgi:hypothetical protein
VRLLWLDGRLFYAFDYYCRWLVSAKQFHFSYERNASCHVHRESGGCGAVNLNALTFLSLCSMDVVCLFFENTTVSEHCSRIYLTLLKTTSYHFLISHPKGFLGAHLDPTKLRHGGLNCQTYSSSTYFFLLGVCDNQISSGLPPIPHLFVAFSAPSRSPRMTR